MASFAKGRMAPNSSVTRKTTRVVSAPSALRLRVVGHQHKFLVDTLARKRLSDSLLAVDIAFNTQVSPLKDGLTQISDKWRIPQMGKFGFVWIGFRHQFAGNIKFQVIAVRANNRFGEPNRFVTSRPVERRL